MGGFVANPPAAAPAPPPVADAIAGEGWHAPLSIAAFMAAQRLPTQVTPIRAREALLGAIVATDVQLAAWRARQEAAGATGLADAVDATGNPLGLVAGEPRAALLWRRAVHATAAADLVETHHDVSATAEGRARAEERVARADDLLRAATLAIRDLTGVGRSRVRLL